MLSLTMPKGLRLVCCCQWDFDYSKLYLSEPKYSVFLSVKPEPQPYGQMIKSGFQDAANPQPLSDEGMITKVFYTTFGNPVNTW
jgi:hypothetical protein